jgi:hypothetical protein
MKYCTRTGGSFNYSTPHWGLSLWHRDWHESHGWCRGVGFRIVVIRRKQ